MACGPLRLTRRTLLTTLFAPFVRGQNVEVTNFDLSLLDDLIVPNEFFFVRDHFPAPNLSAAGFALSLKGAVATPLEIPFDDLSNYPRTVLPVTLECAENPVGGGLVSHAEWSGVKLSAVLEKARPRQEARLVRLLGADGFFREIPLAKAMHPDTMLAMHMNGGKLPPSHGFPLRAIVPGWYAMDSVKWLRAIELREREDDTMPQGFRYRRRVRTLLAGLQESDPVTAMNVKSGFSRPIDGAKLLGRRFIIRGAAWAGEHRVRTVEVSVDGGKTWAAATVSTASQPYAWAQFEFRWLIPKTGDYELVARAADDAGRSQPATRASSRADGYEFNEWQTVRLTVL